MVAAPARSQEMIRTGGRQGRGGSVMRTRAKSADESRMDTFEILRELLGRHRRGLIVTTEGPDHFTLEAPIGPATVSAWHGQRRREAIPLLGRNGGNRTSATS